MKAIEVGPLDGAVADPLPMMNVVDNCPNCKAKEKLKLVAMTFFGVMIHAPLYAVGVGCGFVLNSIIESNAKRHRLYENEYYVKWQKTTLPMAVCGAGAVMWVIQRLTPSLLCVAAVVTGVYVGTRLAKDFAKNVTVAPQNQKPQKDTGKQETSSAMSEGNNTDQPIAGKNKPLYPNLRGSPSSDGSAR